MLLSYHPFDRWCVCQHQPNQYSSWWGQTQGKQPLFLFTVMWNDVSFDSPLFVASLEIEATRT